MRTRKNPEIPMVPKAHLKNVEHQRDQYKAEQDKLKDDISVLKAKVSSLEKIRAFKDSALKGADIKIKTLEQENEEVYYKAQAFDNCMAGQKNMERVYEKEKMLDKIIDIIKTGRNLGDDSDSEIILMAIEHELEYLGAADEKQ